MILLAQAVTAVVMVAAVQESDEGLSLLNDITKAKVLLRGKKDPEKGQAVLVTQDPDGMMSAVRVDMRRRTCSPGFRVRWGNLNGVSTRFEVIKPSGVRVLVVRRHLRHGRVATYVPFSLPLNNPSVKWNGFRYLENLTLEAHNQLERLKVPSRAFKGQLVADVIPIEVPLLLMPVEQIDPYRFLREPLDRLLDEFLVKLGTNTNDAYNYSVSTKGARGPMQHIPGSYRLERAAYPSAKLLPNFRQGMTRHDNAMKATFLHLDYDLSVLSPEQRSALLENPVDLGVYLAAAYNCGPKCAKRALEHGDATLPFETKVYVQKFLQVWSNLGANYDLSAEFKKKIKGVSPTPVRL